MTTSTDLGAIVALIRGPGFGQNDLLLAPAKTPGFPISYTKAIDISKITTLSQAYDYAWHGWSASVLARDKAPSGIRDLWDSAGRFYREAARYAIQAGARVPLAISALRNANDQADLAAKATGAARTATPSAKVVAAAARPKWPWFLVGGLAVLGIGYLVLK